MTALAAGRGLSEPGRSWALALLYPLAAAIVALFIAYPVVELLAASEYFDVPTNPKAKLHDLVKPYQSAKLIDFDFNWAGSSTVRQQLIDKFQNEILAGRK